ncbi:hypothetical protein QBC34DRAFT_424037 [Podospora aff. communis PSN243]|uniref:Uncharacterized protein n=1 Tax=Podospora aff. communis PSN243 TaxID=3040156 RepID=A0AAV9GT52_9PEZI|nr:hypothetical protein QBC34DRAFT_424037 [Podospora aff. communis PSN243]
MARTAASHASRRRCCIFAFLALVIVPAAIFVAVWFVLHKPSNNSAPSPASPTPTITTAAPVRIQSTHFEPGSTPSPVLSTLVVAEVEEVRHAFSPTPLPVRIPGKLHRRINSTTSTSSRGNMVWSDGREHRAATTVNGTRTFVLIPPPTVTSSASGLRPGKMLILITLLASAVMALHLPDKAEADAANEVAPAPVIGTVVTADLQVPAILTSTLPPADGIEDKKGGHGGSHGGEANSGSSFKPGKVLLVVALLASAAMAFRIPAETETVSIDTAASFPTIGAGLTAGLHMVATPNTAIDGKEVMGRPKPAKKTTKKPEVDCEIMSTIVTTVDGTETTQTVPIVCSSTKRSAAAGLRPGIIGLLLALLVTTVMAVQPSIGTEVGTSRADLPPISASTSLTAAPPSTTSDDDDEDYCEDGSSVVSGSIITVTSDAQSSSRKQSVIATTTPEHHVETVTVTETTTRDITVTDDPSCAYTPILGPGPVRSSSETASEVVETSVPAPTSVDGPLESIVSTPTGTVQPSTSTSSPLAVIPITSTLSATTSDSSPAISSIDSWFGVSSTTSSLTSEMESATTMSVPPSTAPSDGEVEPTPEPVTSDSTAVPTAVMRIRRGDPGSPGSGEMNPPSDGGKEQNPGSDHGEQQAGSDTGEQNPGREKHGRSVMLHGRDSGGRRVIPPISESRRGTGGPGSTVLISMAWVFATCCGVLLMW